VSLLASVLVAAPVAHAVQTLPADTTWTGTVVVEDTLEVPAGVTLTIDAGTTVQMKQAVSLRIFGRLLAEGTEAAPIRFTRQSTGTWGRLMFIQAADSRLAHSIVEFSNCAGDHKDYYDDRDASCNPVTVRPARNYHEAVVVIASHADIEGCLFQKLPDTSAGAEGDAIAVISDDPTYPGNATANIRNCRFISIGQGVHTRYSYVLVEDCFFTGHHGDNDDVDLYGESTPVPLIQNNVLVDPTHDDMINPTKCSALITGNVVAGSDDHGIVLRDRCDPVVMNNVIYNCASAGITVQNTCDALIVNNTIADCGRGVRFFDHTDRWGLPYCLTPGSGKATLINCIIWNCPTSLELTESPAVADHGSHATLNHCDVDGGQAKVTVSGASSTVTWGEGNLNVNPLFVDAAGHDYHLLAGSPLVDAGTPERAPAYDIDGKPRPCGAGVDVGASEFGSCGTPQEGHFRRGDINGDGSQDIADPVFLLFYLFAGHAGPTCLKSADTNDNGGLDIADVTFILGYLFTAGAPPPAPGASCGPDPTADALTCSSQSGCN
jgi:hypothetical protein